LLCVFVRPAALPRLLMVLMCLPVRPPPLAEVAVVLAADVEVPVPLVLATASAAASPATARRTAPPRTPTRPRAAVDRLLVEDAADSPLAVDARLERPWPSTTSRRSLRSDSKCVACAARDGQRAGKVFV
jgi:hypothetical protein